MEEKEKELKGIDRLENKLNKKLGREEGNPSGKKPLDLRKLIIYHEIMSPKFEK